MSDYIDRDELIKHIKDLPTWWGDDSVGCAFYLTRAITSIENAPAADVQAVKHGKWKRTIPTPDSAYYCSVCGRWVEREDNTIPPQITGFHYCSHCGAKMEKGESLRQ